MRNSELLCKFYSWFRGSIISTDVLSDDLAYCQWDPFCCPRTDNALNTLLQTADWIGDLRRRSVDWILFSTDVQRTTSGHRLKSANNKTTAMFKALRTPRRIILSGTPIQNDLSEFHAMVCPGNFASLVFAWSCSTNYRPISAIQDF
jgi:SNF2-related domain